MMANYDEAQKPLLRGSNNNIINKEDTIKSIEENKALTRIRFRRVKTTPSTHSNPLHSTPPPPLSSYISNHKPAFLHVFLVLALYLGLGTICFVLVRAQLDGKKTSDGPCSSHTAQLDGKKATPAQILKEVETNKTKYKLLMALVLLILLITLGTFFLTLHEDMMLIDAFYCVCATITTLGYGDASFVTRGGRIFAVFWILSSTLCLAQFFFYLTEFYTESRRRSTLKWVLSRKLTLSDIEAADLDNDHVVSVAEFILHKLKEMEKINVEDVNLLMDRFRNLDVDESGTLTAADVLVSTEI